MILASPRPVAAVSELAPLLRLRADEIQLQMIQSKLNDDMHMGIPANDSHTNGNSSTAHSHSDSVEYQNGVTSIRPMPQHPHLSQLPHSFLPHQSSPRSLMCGDNDAERDLPPPKYTRYSTCSVPVPFPLQLPRTSQPSTSSVHSVSSSSRSSSTARPSFESFTTPSDHGFTNQRQQGQEQKDNQMSQHGGGAFQPIPPSTSSEVREEQDDAPPYESSFRDTNLSGLPVEALTALSLARENLSDLERVSFFADLDELDRSDDRADPDAIIQRRLTRNALLARQSAITLASASSGSVYSNPDPTTRTGVETRIPSLVVPQRDSMYSAYEYDPVRASVQTYGSSVLTYGSRASQLIDGENITSNGGADGSRPVAPLPWLPRPSALDRIQHCGIHLPASIDGRRARSGSVGSDSGTGRRPLPPLPTPTSTNPSSGPSPTLTRDRSLSLPSRSNSSGSSYSVSSGPTSAGGVRRPRPLPRTPSVTISANPNLPDILEGEASESSDACVPPSSGPVRSNSMFLSPTSAISAAPLSFSPRGRRNASARYSTIGYGHVSRVGVRGVFTRGNDTEDVSESVLGTSNVGQGQKFYSRAASRASTRSARSTYLVPDVDELVRILDSMDDGSGSGSGSSSESCLTTPVVGPGPWATRFSGTYGKTGKTVEEDGEEEIGIGEALACSRSVVNVPCGEKRGASATLEDLGFGVSKSIGLPTPAATPRCSPHRQPANLPASFKNVDTPPVPTPPPRLQIKPLEQEQSHPESRYRPESQAQSPSLTPSDADVLSLTNFPLPPMAPLFIPAPSAVGAGEMPIPSANSGAPPSPSMLDIGKSPAESAKLPGMNVMAVTSDESTQAQPKHITARDAIADLKHRVSELPKFTFPAAAKRSIARKFPSGVPLLGFPVPPRRRAQSVTATNAIAVKKQARIPSAIDVPAANAPPSSFSVGRTSGSTSAPAINQVFEFDKPTVLYETPEPVQPLRIHRTSNQTQASAHAGAQVALPPAANAPQRADALRTTFKIGDSIKRTDPPSADRAQRATSFCVSPSMSSPVVAPLRFKGIKGGSRARSSTVGAIPDTLHAGKQEGQGRKDSTPTPYVDRKSSETDASEESESDHLATPTAPSTTLPNVVEASAANEEMHGHSNAAGISVLNNGTSFSIIQQANGTHISIDPAFADVIKSIAGASEEEQMGSLLTIASSINTEHHASGYNAGFFVPLIDESRTHEDDGFVDIDDEGDDYMMGRKETVRKSMASGISASERRRSKGRSTSSMKKRQSTRSAAAVRAAIRALPDPNTFPIPDSAGSVATDSSTLAAGADYTAFTIRPSPLPKLRVVTKFKGGAVLLPASSGPISATSTKSTMSTFGGGHSRNASAVSVTTKRSSTAGGTRRMNRLTLTDPRSPMGEAAVAAATLVARVRQKRAALATRNRAVDAGSTQATQPTIHVITRGHARTGSASSVNGTLRSKLKMSGGSFFGGSTVRTIPKPGRVAVADSDVGFTRVDVDAHIRADADADVILRSGPRPRRPTILRAQAARASVVPPKGGNELNLRT